MPPLAKKLGKRALRIAAMLSVPYAGVCAFMWLKQDRLLFMPDRVMHATPAQENLAWKDVTIKRPCSHPHPEGPSRRAVCYSQYLADRLCPNV